MVLIQYVSWKTTPMRTHLERPHSPSRRTYMYISISLNLSPETTCLERHHQFYVQFGLSRQIWCKPILREVGYAFYINYCYCKHGKWRCISVKIYSVFFCEAKLTNHKFLWTSSIVSPENHANLKFKITWTCWMDFKCLQSTFSSFTEGVYHVYNLHYTWYNVVLTTCYMLWECIPVWRESYQSNCKSSPNQHWKHWENLQTVNITNTVNETTGDKIKFAVDLYNM